MDGRKESCNLRCSSSWHSTCSATISNLILCRFRSRLGYKEGIEGVLVGINKTKECSLGEIEGSCKMYYQRVQDG